MTCVGTVKLTFNGHGPPLMKRELRPQIQTHVTSRQTPKARVRSRFESAHLSLALSRRLVRDFCFRVAQRCSDVTARSENSHSGNQLHLMRTIILHRFETLEEARRVIGALIYRYNHEWILERLEYRTPVVAREHLAAAA